MEAINMKMNFKSILIIFLVALLGGAVGTYGVIEINKSQEKENVQTVTNQTSVVEQVLYTNDHTGTYIEAIDKAVNTVVEITTQAEVTSNGFFGPSTSNVTSLGSGVIISADGYIATNNHVVQDATSVNVKLQNGESYEATVVGSDPKTDLALIKIDANNLQFASLVDSNTIKVGQEVIAIGNGLGEGTTSSNGIISALNREVTIKNYTMTLILTNAEINSGNSGGGLFDLNGNLIGIVNAKTSNSGLASASIEGIGYAIPANTVKTITDEILQNGYVKDRATLGVKIYDSSYNYYYNIDGLVISEVVEGSAAEKAGLQAGDIIKSMDGVELSEFSQLARLLDDYNIGDKVNLTIERRGERIQVTCILQDASN